MMKFLKRHRIAYWLFFGAACVVAFIVINFLYTYILSWGPVIVLLAVPFVLLYDRFFRRKVNGPLPRPR